MIYVLGMVLSATACAGYSCWLFLQVYRMNAGKRLKMKDWQILLHAQMFLVGAMIGFYFARHAAWMGQVFYALWLVPFGVFFFILERRKRLGKI